MCPEMPEGSFETRYATNESPWVIGVAQPALLELAEQEKIVGDVLDLGCGTGENSLMIAQRGHNVWGLDKEDHALNIARNKQNEQKVEDLIFVKGSAFDTLNFGEGFHTVIDSGLFHFLQETEHAAYLEALRHVMFPHSRLFLLALSNQETKAEDWGARAVKRSELRHLFSVQAGFKVKNIEPSRYVLNDAPQGVKAWLATIVRLPDS